MDEDVKKPSWQTKNEIITKNKKESPKRRCTTSFDDYTYFSDDWRIDISEPKAKL